MCYLDGGIVFWILKYRHFVLQVVVFNRTICVRFDKQRRFLGFAVRQDHILELKCDWHRAEKMCFLLGSGPHFVFLPIPSTAKFVVMLLLCFYLFIYLIFLWSPELFWARIHNQLP